jgi:hypothetical protein
MRSGAWTLALWPTKLWENLPLPTKIGQTRVGGIDFHKLRMQRVAGAVLALSTAPTRFTASDLAQEGASHEC